MKGILRLFWASQENEVGTAQESKGSSQCLKGLGDGIKGEGLGKFEPTSSEPR